MNTEEMKALGIQSRKFQIGHTVKSENATGTVVAIYTEASKPHHRVDVRWANGSKSYRPEDGLEKIDRSELVYMTSADLADAMAKLGPMWGLDRPLHNAELGRALRLAGRDVGATIQTWLAPLDRGGRQITGPTTAAIQMMLNGAMPPDPLDTIIRRKG